MKATLVKELQYRVFGDRVTIAVDLEDGIATYLSYAVGRRRAQEFRGDEIETSESDEGIRASVLLETGAADGPIVRLSVFVPEIVPGDEGSFEISAAALRTTRPSGFGGPQPGPVQSYDALSLKGEVTCGAKAPDACHDWAAWHDRMPGHPAQLIVTGTCTFPTSGFEVELRRHEPQGINPRDLLLDKIVTPPSGAAADVVTDVEVRYEEITDADYDTVTILPDGPTIEVKDAV